MYNIYTTFSVRSLHTICYLIFFLYYNLMPESQADKFTSKDVWIESYQ